MPEPVYHFRSGSNKTFALSEWGWLSALDIATACGFVSVECYDQTSTMNAKQAGEFADALKAACFTSFASLWADDIHEGMQQLIDFARDSRGFTIDPPSEP